MRVHRNAKTTPKMQQLIVTRAQQGWTYARIAPVLHSIDSIAPIALTTEAIALRAFDLYQQRGAHDGRDLDDWLEAERQLREERREQLVIV